MSRPFLNIAHRGARAFAPENTLPAIRLAKRIGANVVELDVQMSRDGELIVFHDDGLTRCSDALYKFPNHTDYSVSALTWEELALLDVGTWYVHELSKPSFRRERYLRDLTAEEVQKWITPADADEEESGAVRIPSLREALVTARRLELGVILDIKTIPRRYPGIAGQVIALVRELAMVDETMISSFDHALLAEARRLDAAIATGVLTSERLYRAREYLKALDADAFEPADETDWTAIQELTDTGLWVNVWTVNNESRMRTLIDVGVTGIITDYPNRLARVLSDLGRTVPVRPRMRR